MLNEGYCLKCARSLGLPQTDEVVKQMGISEEDLDMFSDEMSTMFGQSDNENEEDGSESRTATFPLFNQLFGHRQRCRNRAGDSDSEPPPEE